MIKKRWRKWRLETWKIDLLFQSNSTLFQELSEFNFVFNVFFGNVHQNFSYTEGVSKPVRVTANPWFFLFCQSFTRFFSISSVVFWDQIEQRYRKQMMVSLLSDFLYMLNHIFLNRNPRPGKNFSKKSKTVKIQEQDLLKTFSLGVQKSPMSFGVPSGCKDTLKLPLLPEKLKNGKKNTKKVVEISEGCLWRGYRPRVA